MIFLIYKIQNNLKYSVIVVKISSFLSIYVTSKVGSCAYWGLLQITVICLYCTSISLDSSLIIFPLFFFLDFRWSKLTKNTQESSIRSLMCQRQLHYQYQYESKISMPEPRLHINICRVNALAENILSTLISVLERIVVPTAKCESGYILKG